MITLSMLFYFSSLFCCFSGLPLHFDPAAGESTALQGNFYTSNKTMPSAAVHEVLFATNDDCDLYINDTLKGLLSKKEHLYVSLPAGTYTYTAKSKSVPGEIKANFSVKDGSLNEIFIDLLYLIDENKLQKTTAANTTAVAPKTITPAKQGTDVKLADKKTEITREVEKVVINNILSNMVVIKGGNFIMGNNKAPAADELEHAVSVNDVVFSKYEVTQEQWEIMMGYNPSENKGCSTCPVENVSWEEAMKFIRKVNIASNKKFRLPTEAEWEYVARLGGKAEIEKAGGQEAYIKKTAWYFANSDKKTQPVGTKEPNVSGIYDLFGNVSEWCSDWYGSYYYKEDDSQHNPEGPPLGNEKVIRGGSIADYTGDRFRPSLRDKKPPTTKSRNVGLRLVMDAS